MWWLKLPDADRIHSQSKKFVTGVN